MNYIPLTWCDIHKQLTSAGINLFDWCAKIKNNRDKIDLFFKKLPLWKKQFCLCLTLPNLIIKQYYYLNRLHLPRINRSFRWKFNNSGESLDVGKERHHRNGSTSILQYTPVTDQVSYHIFLLEIMFNFWTWFIQQFFLI